MDGRERSESAKEEEISDGGGRLEGAFRCHAFIFATHNLEFVKTDLQEMRDAWSKRGSESRTM